MSVVTWREQAVDQERAGPLQGHLHGVCELLRSFRLLRENGMRRLSDGDAA